MQKTAFRGWSARGGTRHITKTLLVMKLTVFLLTVTCLNLAAKGVSQNVTFSGDSVSLENVFISVEKQTGFLFLYSKSVLRSSKPVSISAHNWPLNKFLAEVFNSQPLEYSIDGKNVFVSPKRPTSLSHVLADNPGFLTDLPPITGRVLNKDGLPLEGASVRIKGSKKGTSTDVHGHFTIDARPGDELIISYSGFKSREISISNNNDISTIVLEVSDSKLDEVQIIAYGAVSKRLNTGNVSSIKANEIAKQPVNNPILALQGRAPGIFIEQGSGLPGTSVKVRIQGTNSISSGNEPLYVIDGVPYLSELAGSIRTLGATNPLHFVNPADIASIDVLKDADATAIYGSRAANGAILITTKTGRSGKFRFDLNAQTGEARVNRRLTMLPISEFLQYRREAFKNDGIDLDSPPYNSDLNRSSLYPDISGWWDTTRQVNWQKELLGGAAHFQDVQGTFSGGTNQMNYSLGGTYHRETTVFPGSFADTKASVHVALSGRSKDDKASLQFRGDFLSDNNQLPNEDLTAATMTLFPNTPSLLKDDGTLNWAPDINGNSSMYVDNPLQYWFNRITGKSQRVNGSLTFDYQLLKDITFRALLGYTRLRVDEKRISISLSRPPEYIIYNPRSNTQGYNDQQGWNIEPQLNYKKKISAGQLDVLLGSTLLESRSSFLNLAGYGYPSDQVVENITFAQSLMVNSTTSLYHYNAIFGRLNYNWDSKYIFSLNARRDGSSRFGSANKFHTFGSAAIAWIFTNEHFIKNSVSFLSFGKLGLSYGTTGNDQFSDYKYQSLYEAIDDQINPYQGARAITPSGLANPYLQWEETRKLNIGLNLGFLKDRFQLVLNHNRNRSSNQLLNYSLSSFAGFSSIVFNRHALIENTGWETTLSGDILDKGAVKWNSSFVITFAKNKLLDYPGLAQSSYYQMLTIGKSVNILRLFHYMGVNPDNGLYQFLDHKGNLTSNPLIALTDNDAMVEVNPDPVFYGGWQNTFRYKGFELSFTLQFTKQEANNLFAERLFIWAKDLENRWRKPGDIAPMQRAYSAYQSNDIFRAQIAFRSSDYAWSDASYIRLKNTSLYWDLPSGWISRLRADKAQLFIQGQNLATITSYKGLDPESKSSLRLPPLRVITLGIKLSL